MKTMGTRCAALLLGLAVLLQHQMIRTAMARRSEGAGANESPERGDVPGWVMITLMSAVLVAALLALAGPALEAMFNQAMDKVGN
jgi:type VI protein secretion system component VasF